MASYRLLEQQLGTLWIFPYVVETDSEYELTLAVVLGHASPEQEVPSLNADNLVLELRDEEGGEFEITEEPAGELPVAGGPSFTANARVAFRRTERRPYEFVVKLTHSSHPAIFPWGQTAPVRANYLINKPTTIQRIGKLLKQLLFPKQATCVKSFNTPDFPGACVIKNNFVGRQFYMNAEFQPLGNADCGACEYRQFIRGSFRMNGRPFIHQLPDGQLHPKNWLEDGIVRSNGQKRYYGHRAHIGISGDLYSDPNRKSGCRYQGSDYPRLKNGSSAKLEADLYFWGQIINPRLDTIIAERFWEIKCNN